MGHQANKEIVLAVLPFQILTEEKDLSPVISCFTEDLIINFSRFIGLAVISQYSTQNIQHPGDKAAISKLKADYLIAGSFRTMGNDIRIQAQLIRTADEQVVFAVQHNESGKTLLSAQDKITRQIVSVLQQQIDYDLLSYSYKKKTVALAAYEHWLIGMDHLKKGSLENDLKARSYFEAALKIDPQYARAYTGLSLSYFNEWSCQLWDRWDVSRKGAHKYALKALELDENDYISLTVLGRTYLFLEEYEKAEHCLRKSILMNPNDADNLVQVAFSFLYINCAEEAARLYEKACELNPMRQGAYFGYGSNIYFELGQFDHALELSKKVNLESLWVDFAAYTAAACFHLSRFEEMWKNWNLYLKSFEERIYTGKRSLHEEALQWQMNVNPYLGKTNLQPFWEYMSKTDKPGEAIPSHSVPFSSTAASLLQQGESWTLTFQGEQVIMKDTKGLHDLVKLIAEPGREFHCLELMGSGLGDSNGEALLDNKAKTAYRQRILELQAQIAEAEDFSHSQKAVQLQEEYEQLIDHLSTVTGLGGKTRTTGSPVEKARSAVTWRVRSTIKKIADIHSPLARHLNVSIKTGTFCSYCPEQPILWSL